MHVIICRHLCPIIGCLPLSGLMAFRCFVVYLTLATCYVPYLYMDCCMIMISMALIMLTSYSITVHINDVTASSGRTLDPSREASLIKVVLTFNCGTALNCGWDVIIHVGYLEIHKFNITILLYQDQHCAVPKTILKVPLYICDNG